MDPKLLINNIGHTVSILISLGIITLVYLRAKDKKIRNVFCLLTLTSVVWETSYLFGSNISDPSISRIIFMFNMVTILLIVLQTHLVLYVTERYEKRKNILKGLYAIATLIIIFFISFPNYFLKLSEPKLYFPNFYVAGDYYSLGDAFFFAVLVYLFYQLIAGYIKADRRLKNCLKYYIFSLVFGYAVALTPEFLLYNIDIDPFITFFFGLYIIPMTYAIVEYDLISINIVAKRAFGYALAVAGIALCISFMSDANDLVISYIPTFPHWVLPVLSGIIAVSTGAFVWKKVRETDVLKDEFINVIMHKFRTPLTNIKWTLETLNASSLPPDEQSELNSIKESSDSLIDLTNTMVNLANTDANDHAYKFTKENLVPLLKDTIRDREFRAHQKNISLVAHVQEKTPSIYCDAKRLQFVFETIVDNAINYSTKGGTVEISLGQDIKNVLFSVKDSGMGISKEDANLIFSKFFRGAGARENTEGMGIGLFISKNIVERHGGRIWIESDGIGKGSKFYINLPIKS